MKCEHGPIEEGNDTRWLAPGSVQHDVLGKIVNDKVLMEDVSRLKNFCHTGQLESYHSSLLRWCPKRTHFFSDGMRTRTELACLHHNHNVGRQQAHTAAGTPRYKLVFPKAKGEWVVKKVYKKTDMAILIALMHDVHDVKVSLSHGEAVECISNYTVPKDIPKNIATKEAPKKKDAVAEHQTRLQRMQ